MLQCSGCKLFDQISSKRIFYIIPSMYTHMFTHVYTHTNLTTASKVSESKFTTNIYRCQNITSSINRFYSILFCSPLFFFSFFPSFILCSLSFFIFFSFLSFFHTVVVVKKHDSEIKQKWPQDDFTTFRPQGSYLICSCKIWVYFTWIL